MSWWEEHTGSVTEALNSPMWLGAFFAGLAAWVRCKLKQHMRFWAAMGEGAGCALLSTMLIEVARVMFPEQWEHLGDQIAIMISIFVGWVGTDGIMVLCMRIFNWKFPKTESTDAEKHE